MLKYIKQLLSGEKRTKESFLSEKLLSNKEIKKEDSPKNDEVLQENFVVNSMDNTTLMKEDKLISNEKLDTPYNPNIDLRDYEYPHTNLLDEEYRNYIYQFYKDAKSDLPIIWSVENNQTIIKDLAELKNILIAGSQATGKTSFIHQLLISMLFKKHPSQLKLILIDIKGVEFLSYLNIEKFFLSKLPGEENSILQDYKKVIHTLNALCIEMDNRYNLLRDAKTRNIKEYNEKFINKELNPDKGHQFLPFIVFIIDDLSAYNFNSKEELNLPIQRLVNEAYKVGIFSIISTSQFSANIMPANLFSIISQRVVFRLNSKEDYRKFFDTVKVDRNLENGEFLYNDSFRVAKGSSVFLKYSDIDLVCKFISNQRGYPQAFLLPEYVNEKKLKSKDFDSSSRDPLFEDAARLVVSSQIGSTSLIQRRMKLGYNRAERLMDQLEAAGIVGPNQGSKARDVQVRTDMELEEILSAY